MATGVDGFVIAVGRHWKTVLELVSPNITCDNTTYDVLPTIDFGIGISNSFVLLAHASRDHAGCTIECMATLRRANGAGACLVRVGL